MVTSLLSLFAASPLPSDTRELQLSLHDEAGRPLPGVPLRVVLAGEGDPADPASGLRGRSNGEGRVHRRARGGAVRLLSRIAPGARLVVDRLAVAVEIERAGDPMLCVITLDQLADASAVRARREAFTRGPEGRFDRRLAGAGLGYDTRWHDLCVRKADDGTRHWVARLELVLAGE